MKEIESICSEIIHLTEAWESRLAVIDENILSSKRNNQNRTIKQIVGHLIDSASNNIHRVVHLQYQPSPFEFPTMHPLVTTTGGSQSRTTRMKTGLL